MALPAVEERARSLLSSISSLSNAFRQLPDTIPYYHEVGNYDSTLTAAHDLYDDLAESTELARVVAWLGHGFGTLKRGLIIPERGLRLQETIEQLEVSVEKISEQRHKPESTILDELSVVEEWIQALLATATASVAPRVAAPAKQCLSTLTAPSGLDSRVRHTPTPRHVAASPAHAPLEVATAAPVPIVQAVPAHTSDMNRARQAKLDAFPRMSRHEQALRERDLASERAENREGDERAAEIRRERKAEKLRHDARLRKRKERAKKAAALAAQRAQLAASSRPKGQSKYFSDSRAAAVSTHRKTYKRKNGTSEPARHRSTWARKEYFKYFEQAVRVVGFQSATDIALGAIKKILRVSNVFFGL